MRVKVTGKGVQDILASLDRAIHETPDELRRNLDRAVDDTCEAMRSVAPVRSGRLKASGQWSSVAEGDVYLADITFGGELAPYAEWALRSGSNGVRMDSAFALGEIAIDDAISAAFPF